MRIVHLKKEGAEPHCPAAKVCAECWASAGDNTVGLGDRGVHGVGLGERAAVGEVVQRESTKAGCPGLDSYIPVLSGRNYSEGEGCLGHLAVHKGCEPLSIASWLSAQLAILLTVAASHAIILQSVIVSLVLPALRKHALWGFSWSHAFHSEEFVWTLCWDNAETILIAKSHLFRRMHDFI